MDLQQLAGRVAGLAFGDEPARISATWRLPGNSAQVYRFEYALENRRESVYVKLPHDTARGREEIQRLRREFRITRAVKAAFPETPALRTVSPVGLLKDDAAFATWEIPGISLQYLINSGLRFRLSDDPTPIEEYVVLAGDWLRRFHALGLSEGPPDLGRTFEYCCKRLDTLVACPNSGISGSRAEALKAALSDWTRALSGQTDTLSSLCHNDYSPHNILVTRDGIGVLDFSFSAPGLKIFDVACFWHKLEDLKSSPFYSNRIVGRLQQRFLAAYGTDWNPNRPETRLGLMRLVLSKLVGLCRDSPRRPDRWLENQRRHAAYRAFLDSCL